MADTDTVRKRKSRGRKALEELETLVVVGVGQETLVARFGKRGHLLVFEWTGRRWRLGELYVETELSDDARGQIRKLLSSPYAGV